MKNKFKLVVSLMLSAVFALALTLGVANVNVAKADGEANAVTLDHDLTDYLQIHDRGTNGDYKEAALFRIKSPSDPTTGWVKANVCLNEGGNETNFAAIKINGKSLPDIRAEYLELIKKAEVSPITWTNYPDNGEAYPHTMQGNIKDEVIDNNGKSAEEKYARYAPVFVTTTHHDDTTLKSGLDLYIPNILFEEGGLLEGGVRTIEITSDFVLTDDNEETWGLSQNVIFKGLHTATHYKTVGADNVIDVTDTIFVQTELKTGDFSDAYLLRISMDNSFVAGGDSWTNGACANEAIAGHEGVLKALKINGKSVYDIRAEYADLIASGAESPIKWTGTMQGNIVSDVEAGRAIYAPIFVWMTCHSGAAGVGNSIDMYIPVSLYPNGIDTFELDKGFMWEDKTGEVTGTYAIRNDITWKWGLNKPVKIVENETVMPSKVIPTDITSVDGSYGAGDRFLSFYLSACDYSGNTVALADEDLLGRINYYNYIEIDGQKLGSMWGSGKPDERFFNVWGRNNSFSTRWPNSIKDSQEACDAVQTIKVLKGCQFPSQADPNGTVYEVQNDVVLHRGSDGLFYREDKILMEGDVVVSEINVDGEASELYRIDVQIDKFNWGEADGFDVNYFGASNAAWRKSFLINGKSLYEINTTYDDSAYEYATSPQTNTAKEPGGSGYDLFANPTIMKMEKNSGLMHIYVFKQYILDTVANGEDVVLTVNVCAGGLVSAAPVEFVLMTLPYDVTINGETIKVAKGDKVARPADPTKEATVDKVYTFAGWFVGDVEYDFEAPVTSDLTIEARYNEAPRMYNLTMTVAGIDGIPPQAGQIPYGTEMPFVEMAEDLAVEGYEHVVTVNGEEIDPATYVHTVEGDVTIVVTYTAIEQGGGDVEDDSEEESTPVEDDSEEESEAPATSEEESKAPATSEEESKAPATSEKESAPAEEKGGCMGAIGSTAGLLVAMLGAVVIIRKKRA